MSAFTEDMLCPSWWPEQRVKKVKRILGRFPHNRRARRLDRERMAHLVDEWERKERLRRLEEQGRPQYDAFSARVAAADAAWGAAHGDDRDDDDDSTYPVALKVRPRWRRVVRIPRLMRDYRRHGFSWWMALRQSWRVVWL